MKTKEDYAALGKRHRQTGVEKHPYPRSGTSWQAKAYWEGYDKAKPRFNVEGAQTRRFTSNVMPVGSIPKPPQTRQDAAGAAIGPAEGGRAIFSLELLRERSRGWPGAAQEHLLELAADFNMEKNLDRAARLDLAVQRLFRRHGKRRDFPVSTQPHPDGPATVGMLLEGR